jgi:hypothetical protein
MNMRRAEHLRGALHLPNITRQSGIVPPHLSIHSPITRLLSPYLSLKARKTAVYLQSVPYPE